MLQFAFFAAEWIKSNFQDRFIFGVFKIIVLGIKNLEKGQKTKLLERNFLKAEKTMLSRTPKNHEVTIAKKRSKIAYCSHCIQFEI